MNRRHFIQGSATGSALAAMTIQAATAAPEMPRAVLGRTGVEVSRLGLGCWQIGQKDFTQADVDKVVNRAIELGVTYFDTAPNYGASEERLGPALKQHRDKVFLVTKTEEQTAEGTWKLIRRSLDRLKTDRLDLVHIHSLGVEERFPDLKLLFSKKGALGALLEAKQQKVIRFIGVSGHSWPSRFHHALDTGEIDVMMNAVSFVAQHVYDFEHKVWSRARQMNVGLVAMKVIGGSKPNQTDARLAGEWYDRAVSYALSVPKVTTAVIGVRNVAEVETAVRAVREAKALSGTEMAELYRKGLEMAGDPLWHQPYGAPTE